MSATGNYFTSYLPANAKEQLAQYTYHGQDKSLIYKYFWRPLCGKVVKRLPVWLAPNVITVAALAFVCVTHFLLQGYVPKMTVKRTSEVEAFYNGTAATDPTVSAKIYAKEFLPPPPRYVFFLSAFALFTYQLLDNLDGHQARRTRTSSPLGLLMDHGCDAFNCIVGSLSVASALSLGPTWKTWVFTLTTVIVFFLNTWEEYYKGELILPIINGPNEGILIAIVLYIITGFVDSGPQWWYENRVRIPRSWLPAIIRQDAVLAERVAASTHPSGTGGGSLSATHTKKHRALLGKRLKVSNYDFDSPQQAAAFAVEDLVLGRVCPHFVSIQDQPHNHGGASGSDTSLLQAVMDSVSSVAVPTTIGYYASSLIGIDCAAAWNGTAFSSQHVSLSAYWVSASEGASALGSNSQAMTTVTTPIQRSVLRMFNPASGEVEIRYNTLAVLFAVVSAFLTCLGNVVHVYTAIHKERRERMEREAAIFRGTKEKQLTANGKGSQGQQQLQQQQQQQKLRWSFNFKETFPFIHSLTRLTPLFVLTMFAQLWFMTSPGNIFRDHPRICCWTVGLLYTKLAIHLMIAHLCSVEFLPFRRTFFPFLMFFAHSALSYIHDLQTQKQFYISNLLFSASTTEPQQQQAGANWNEEVTLIEFFLLTVISFAHLVFTVVRETAQILEVPIFTVPKAKQQQLLEDLRAEKAAAASGRVGQAARLSTVATTSATSQNSKPQTQTSRKKKY